MNLQDRRLHERSLELAATAIDFSLTAAETTELEAHLAACPTCARRAAALRADASTLGRPLTLLPARRVDDAVYAAIASPSARPQRLWLLVAAALLLLTLLGAVAVGAYLLRSWQTLPTTVVPSPTAPVAVVSPGPDASPVVVGETWETLEFQNDPRGGSMEAVTFAGADLVGVGSGGCVPDVEHATACYAAAWTGASGGAWVRAPDQPGLEVGLAVGTSSPQAGIFGVAAGPAGTVAIGYADDGRPRIWRSPDGRTWQRLEPFGSSPIVSRLGAIVRSPGGYVVVGWVVDSASQRARAAAWTSPDGATWTRADDTADMDVGQCFLAGDDFTCGGMLGVVATASGLVAVGHDRTAATGTGPSRPAAWRSPDGLTWTRSDDGLDFDGSLAAVTVGGPGLVAVGTICQPDCFEPTAGGVAATSVDGSTWTVVPVTGAAALQDVVWTGGRSFALGVLYQDVDPRGEVQLWRSADGVAWQHVTGLPSIQDAYGGADIAAASDRIIIVGWESVTGVDGTRNFAYASPPFVAEATPGPSPSPSAGPTSPVPGTIPVPAGSVGAAPGPDGGLYVLIDARGDFLDGPPSRSVLALLDATGSPRAGWPIELEGWSCSTPNPSFPIWAPALASDGSVRLVCTEDGPEGPLRHLAFAFDASGHTMPGWPVELPAGDIWEQPRVVVETLYVLAREVPQVDASGPISASYWLTTVAADGAIRNGSRHEVPDVSVLGNERLGPDGTAYLVNFLTTEVMAFDLDGSRLGWPIRIEGVGGVGDPAFGPDGRIYLVAATRQSVVGATASPSRTLAFDRDGQAVPLESVELPTAAFGNGTFAGAAGMPPSVGADGTVFIVGDVDGREMTVFALDPSGAVMAGWPYRSDVGLEYQGACSGLDAGCGVFRATPVVGPGNILFMPLAAADAKKGGSLLAIGPDGRVVPGWPVVLQRPGAAFWSVVAAQDGMVYALAVEPETAGRSSATILAIAPDSTIRYRTTVVEP